MHVTLFEFKELTESRQCDVIKEHGVCLAERSQGGTRILLYQVNSFYIELFHDIFELETNELRILRTFVDPRHLDRYFLKTDIFETGINNPN